MDFLWYERRLEGSPGLDWETLYWPCDDPWTMRREPFAGLLYASQRGFCAALSKLTLLEFWCYFCCRRREGTLDPRVVLLRFVFSQDPLIFRFCLLPSQALSKRPSIPSFPRYWSLSLSCCPLLLLFLTLQVHLYPLVKLLGSSDTFLSLTW